MSSDYPGGFENGVTIRGVPLTVLHPGEVFWVNNSGVLAKNGRGASNSNRGTYKEPFLTIEGAMNSGRLVANRGDILMVMPGHSEDVTAAAGITFDINGVAIVGLGTGSKQSQIKFSTIASADIDISAANVTFYNMRFTAAVADVTVAIDCAATADDLSFVNCRFDESATDLNYVVVLDAATGLDGLYVENCHYIGGDASNDTFLQLAGTHDRFTLKGCRMIHGVAQTATAGMVTCATAVTNALIVDNYMHTESAAVSAGFVVLTGTTNTGWAAGNRLSHVDTDAAAADSVAAFDVTGLASFDNLIAATGDIYGVQFATAEDLT